MAIKTYTRAPAGSPHGLFDSAVSLEIPPFQRPYVWQKDRHWVPLWEDVLNLADAVLEATNDGETSLLEDQEPTPATHFLGAVVLHRWSGEVGAIPVYRVIDGQQRLTTLQLLLHAAMVAYEQREFEQAGLLSDLVFNNPKRTKGDEARKLKIVPTRANRADFLRVMQGKSLAGERGDSPIVSAHDYFHKQVSEWLDGDESTAAARAEAMHIALSHLIQLVVIELDHTADPQIIFETLNARGEPLLQSDLVRNYIIYVAERQGYSSDVVAGDWLARYDDGWWKDKVAQGRTRRERVEQFLNYWLVMRLAREVKAGDIFSAFREHVSDHGDAIREIVDAMEQSSDHYMRVIKAPPDSLAATQLRRLRALDAGAVTPIILWLMSNVPTEHADITARAIRVLESYYVRRILCGFASMGINKVMHGALEHLAAGGALSADRALIQHLAAQTTERRVWPTDGDVRSALLKRRIDSMARSKLLVVLEALAQEMVPPKSESFDYSSLTIEHVMPQTWRDEKWGPPTAAVAEVGETAEMARDRLIHSIGNLTLVTGSLNAALSNDPWSAKRAQIEKHSYLPINRDLIDEAGDVWDEQAIIDRGQRLAEIAISVWPGPDQI